MVGKVRLVCCVGLAVWAALLLAQPFSAEKNRAFQEKQYESRMAALKAETDSLYFAATGRSLKEQERIAATLVEDIKRLSAVRGFDTVDHEAVLDKMKSLLRLAPQTQAAKQAHWEIHNYYLDLLGEPDYGEARDALESFLHKHENAISPALKIQAYDKLCVIARRMKDMGLLLYYTDKHLALNPGNPSILLYRAEALIALGGRQEAERILEDILRKSPGSVQYNLALELMAKANPGSADGGESANYLKTIGSMKTIATALEIYCVDQMRYPERLSDLAPMFIKTVPQDAWQKDFFYRAGADGQGYALASAGSDGKFLGFEQRGDYTALQGQDIVMKNAELVFSPRR